MNERKEEAGLKKVIGWIKFDNAVRSFVHEHMQYDVLSSTELHLPNTEGLMLMRVTGRSYERGKIKYCIIQRLNKGTITQNGAIRPYNEFYVVGDLSDKPGRVISQAAVNLMREKYKGKV